MDVVLKNDLENYIKNQNDVDKRILHLFIFDEERNMYRIANITGYSLPRINLVIRKLRHYLKKCGYC